MVLSNQIWSAISNKAIEIRSKELSERIQKEVNDKSPEGQYFQAYKELFQNYGDNKEQMLEVKKHLLGEILSFRDAWSDFMQDQTGDIRLPRAELMEQANLISVSDARYLSSVVKSIVSKNPNSNPKDWIEQIKAKLKSDDSPFLDRPFLIDYALPSVILPVSKYANTPTLISMLGHSDPALRFILQYNSTNKVSDKEHENTSIELDPKKTALSEAAFSSRMEEVAGSGVSPEAERVALEFDSAQKVFHKDPLAEELGLIKKWQKSEASSMQVLERYVNEKRQQQTMIQMQKDAWDESKVGRDGLDLMVQSTLKVDNFNGTKDGVHGAGLTNLLYTVIRTWLLRASERNENISNDRVIDETQWLARKYLELYEKQSRVTPDSPALKDALRDSQHDWKEFTVEVNKHFGF